MNRTEAARELGVAPSAAPDRVEAAFRVEARRRHPDLGGDAVQFRRATEARAVLLCPRSTDPVVRALELVVRYHPGVRLLEAVVRVVERRVPTR